jgi:hypothetical protein
MSEGPSKLEAVRLAKERLGEAPAQAMADFIESQLGLKVQPAIVTVLLASLREREHLEQSKLKAEEVIQRARAEQAEAGAGEGGKRSRAPRARQG